MNLDLIIDFHKSFDRQGPGDAAQTWKALELLGIEYGPKANIADIGCGTGGQTIALAEKTGASITAVDLFPAMLTKLEERVGELGIADRITTLAASMLKLPFEAEEFDLIWSEGAIYIMGFAEGLAAWRRFLKSGGCLVASELSWLRADRPAEAVEFWESEYAGMGSIAANIRHIEEGGYAPLAHFILPAECWHENYYGPRLKAFDDFLEEQGNSEDALSFVASERREIEMFSKFSDYYGYVFYLMRKVD